MFRLLRRLTQCSRGIHWRPKYDSGIPHDIGSAGSCEDCGEKWTGIDWGRRETFPRIDWSTAPKDATHAFRTLNGRPYMFENHSCGMVYRYTAGVPYYYRHIDEIAIETRIAR